MKSLRLQLLLGTALGTTAVLLVSGGVLYALISRVLRADFDDALAAKARSLAALAELDEDGLEFELAAASLPEFAAAERAEYYQVWLPDGVVFARSPSLGNGDLEQIAGTSDAPAFRTVRLPDGRPGRTVGLTFVPRLEYEDGHASTALTVTLVVAREVSGLEATLARVRGLMIGVGLFAVALSAGLLAWLVHRKLRPIARLSGQIAQVGESDLSKRIGEAEIPSELAPVVNRLNDLLARLEAAFERERRFTGDVAHELRTPLAGLRAKLELALSRERAPEVYRNAMSDCLEINLQMQRMVENLLHLARADAGQLEIHHEPVDVSELARECWKPLEEKALARGLRVEWRLNAPGPVETDRDKLRLVIQNILDNAVVYTNDEGQITVSMSAENGAVVLAVNNTGSSLPPHDRQRVFDRFWRADPSRRQANETRCGLGLPLCKALVEQLGGTIAATASAAGVFTITVRLPRVRPDAPLWSPRVVH
jgi:two-component system heavy metal sensor histidine kinase CusS